MDNQLRQPKKRPDRLKKLLIKHQHEQRRLQSSQQTRSQSFMAKHRLAYETVNTELERTNLLTAYVQKIRNLHQLHEAQRQQLLARQALQREALLKKYIDPAQLIRRSRLDQARSILEAATKLGCLPSNWAGG